MDEVRALDLNGVDVLGVTSGASTPERFFTEAVRYLRNVPRHVAIVMDGNGRWASQRGKKRGEGHVAGAETLSKVLEWCGDRGIAYLTVYAFSTENWKRPKAEVDGLMSLFAHMLKLKGGDFVRKKVRFRMIGRRGDLSKGLLATIEELERRTAGFERQFIVAISYGGRAEIVDAVNEAIRRGEPMTEETFSRCLYAPDVPDPDLVIRTSGELRTSNFLLWESAYSEYYFTDVLWPDFSESDLDKALESYASRHRRMGGV
ncbi:MAG: di-trans,poly-cis-decaprenylcistransferase [Kiritimatiellae bacterium]|nr:di-trans,poly-cis-decaprenylcistransferase [Kiritimatiellia bacterium]